MRTVAIRVVVGAVVAFANYGIMRLVGVPDDLATVGMFVIAQVWIVALQLQDAITG